MTVNEYIDQNLPFYHITNMVSLDSVLKSGLQRSLKPGSRRGICVVRCKNDDIISEIIDRQLQCNGSEKFALIELFPNEKNITAADVSKDPIDEAISPICNYICKEPIYVNKENIVKIDIPVGLWHSTTSEVVELTNYSCPIPPINR